MLKCSISTAPYTDHDKVLFTLQPESQPRGPGFWKFNTSFLRNTDYVNTIKATIKESFNTVKEYEDKGLIWDFVKMKIRSNSVWFAKKTKREENQLENMYTSELSKLNCHLAENHSTTLLDQIDVLKKEIERIQMIKTNGVIVRTKMVNIEEGEKNSSFFLSLEKHRSEAKSITLLKVNENTISKQEHIMNEIFNFYSNLYKDKSTVNIKNPNEFLADNNIPILTNVEREQCEGLITEGECLSALKQMKSNKSPGLDGIPSEFYKFFWNDIKHIVLDSLNYALKKEELSMDQRRGVITLIPKKDKNRQILKNWRPISLLTVDYKLLAKSLANRIKKVIDKLICNDQTGYIKGRYIGENIRTIQDMITYLKIKNKTGILLLIDFEKAFDSVRWDFMAKTLKAFKFGPIFQKWVKVLYTNSQSSVLNNGHQTPFFQLEQGVRQGCPLSAFLFILVVELLAIQIRTSNNIKGIQVADIEIKISQLADDTSLFIRDTDSIKNIFSLLERFETNAGLKANVEKTKFYNIGNTVIDETTLLGPKFEKTPIQILGITVTDDENISIEHNFTPRVKAIENILKHWSRRKLSLKGKITVINSLALSLIVYPASNLSTPNLILESLQHIFYEFLWDGK